MLYSNVNLLTLDMDLFFSVVEKFFKYTGQCIKNSYQIALILHNYKIPKIYGQKFILLFKLY